MKRSKSFSINMCIELLIIKIDMKNIIYVAVLGSILASCGMPPDESVSGGMYKQCTAMLEFIEKVHGSSARDQVKKQREKCSCQAKVYWEYEQKYGWLFSERAEFYQDLQKRCGD